MTGDSETAAPARRESIHVGRMKQGFIDPRDLAGGWKKYLAWKPEQYRDRPGFVAYGRDRAAGCRSEIDRMAEVRSRMFQDLVLYNAYLGAGKGLKGLEIISQGTGVGCGGVNSRYGTALKHQGMLIRVDGSVSPANVQMEIREAVGLPLN